MSFNFFSFSSPSVVAFLLQIKLSWYTRVELPPPRRIETLSKVSLWIVDGKTCTRFRSREAKVPTDFTYRPTYKLRGGGARFAEVTRWPQRSTVFSAETGKKICALAKILDLFHSFISDDRALFSPCTRRKASFIRRQQKWVTKPPTWAALSVKARQHRKSVVMMRVDDGRFASLHTMIS